MTETIRYYVLEGRATYVINAAGPPTDKTLGDFKAAIDAEKEVPLSQHEFHDFILNKQSKMRAVINETMYRHRKCQDFVSKETQ